MAASVSGNPRVNLWSKRTLLGLLMLTCMGVAWFGLAGRIDWVQGWIFLLSFGFFSNGLALWLAKTNPQLFEERNRKTDDIEPWDRTVVKLYNLLVTAVLIIAALDSGRFHWSSVALSLQILSWLNLILGAAAIVHVMKVNNYLSSMVRIQEDRGHQVCSEGLYAVVRHPMYTAIFLCCIALPPALGSFWALIPGASAAILFVYRTAREDRTLHDKLVGYPAYADKVRFRLFPGIW